jgi:hypothetical protein
VGLRATVPRIVSYSGSQSYRPEDSELQCVSELPFEDSKSRQVSKSYHLRIVSHNGSQSYRPENSESQWVSELLSRG